MVLFGLVLFCDVWNVKCALWGHSDTYFFPFVLFVCVCVWVCACARLLIFWNRAHAPLSDNGVSFLCVLSFAVIHPPFRIEVIVLLLYHLFLYAITLTIFFSNWTHAFDYNFRKWYCQNLDITHHSVTSTMNENEKKRNEMWNRLIQVKKYRQSFTIQ